jgi:hypothetical protein
MNSKFKDFINNKLTFTFFVILVFSIIPINSYSQSDIENDTDKPTIKKFNKWNITANYGQTIAWMDYNQEPDNPFGNYFTDRSSWNYGFILTRKLGKTFTANIQYIGGSLQGNKTRWSNGDTADVSFKTNFNDISINFEVDLMNLVFEKKDRRWFTAYLKGGIGYIMYDPSIWKTSDGTIRPTEKGASLIIPWGWGARSDISKHWSIRFENTFHHAFADDLEGNHNPEYSSVNDIYNYTSIGVTYHIFQKPKQPKKPKIEEIPIPEDTAVAAKEEVFELSIASNIPSSMHPFDTTTVIIKINKGDIDGAAKLQQTIPEGFIVKELLSAGAKYEFTNGIMSYSWDELPESEYVSITYKLITKDAKIGSTTIPGILFYTQDDKEQIRQFKKEIEIKPEAIVTKTPVLAEEETTSTETTSTAGNTGNNINKKVVYRVQVYTVYKGSTSSKMLQKRLNLDYEVSHYYDGNYTKYTSGEFATYEEAAAYKKKLRNSTVSGAFVVGFYEGERVQNIQDAIKLEKGENTAKINSTEKGINYRIQILASKKNLSIEEVKNITGISRSFNKVTHNGLYKYEIGPFSTYSEAKTNAKEIRKIVSGAFIVKYKDGNRL